MVDAGGVDKRRNANETRRLKVFISYSRSDSRFAAEILAGLAYDGGFEPLIDAHSIHEGEKWKARISTLISEADTCVVILTTSWLASGMCRFELDEALHLSKRIIPVQPSPLDYGNVPHELASINAVRFDQNTDGTPRLFMDGMTALRSALVTDLVWVREHTRLLTRAAEWDSAGRIANRMLSGPDIKAAKEWLEKRPSGAPIPTELHRDYIAASEQAEVARLSVERQRADTLHRAYVRARGALIAASLAAIVATGAGAFAYTKKLDAQRSEILASQERDAALIVQSRHLADIAGTILAAGDATTATLLALAGLPDTGARSSRPYVPEVEGRLYESYVNARERALFDGHDGPVLGVAASNDGKLLITGSADQTARIWDTASGKVLQSIKRQDGPVNSVAITPDAKRIVTASGGMAHIVDATSGKTSFDLRHDGEVLQVALSRDGNRLVTASEDRTARVWDMLTGREIARLTGHQAAVTGVALDAAGTMAITGSADTTAAIWDVATATRRVTLEGHALAISGIALSPNGKTVATTSPDRSLRLWDVASGTLVRTISGLGQPVSSIAFASGSKQIVGGASDGTLRIWDTEGGREIIRLAGHSGAITITGFTSPEGAIVSGSADGTARIWSATPIGDSTYPAPHEAAVTAIAIDRKGEHIVSASRDGTARILPTQSGSRPLVLSPGAGEITAVAISPDGRLVATGSKDAIGRIWNSATGTALVMLPGHDGPISSIAFSPDGKTLATGSEDKSARIWEATSGRALTTLERHATRVTGIAFVPGGEKVLTATGTSVRLWQISTGKQLKAFLGHRASVLAVGASPDGAVAASGARDASVRAWNLLEGKSGWRYQASGGAATGVLFTPDGKRVVTGWSDGRVRVLDAATGTLVADLALHDVAITGLALDASHLVTGDSRGGMRIVRFFSDAAALADHTRREMPRCLTGTQRRAFHLDLAPPRWCITGAGLEQVADPASWRPLWPYRSTAWRKWLAARDRGVNSELPGP